MDSFLKAFFFLFISEMGDKTQVVSFAFGAQYKLWTVFTGIFLAVAALMALSVGIGDVASRYLPVFWINIVSGLLFIGFGLWALKGHKEETEKPVGSKFGALVTVMFTFFLAELGDKTILASMTIASQQHQYFAVWLGSTLGMFLADAVAVICGRLLGKKLPEKVLKYGSAAVFIGAGLFTLYDAFAHRTI
jgi:Ca2+/H+ antiporter, TMEM165/GDT1 family